MDSLLSQGINGPEYDLHVHIRQNGKVSPDVHHTDGLGTATSCRTDQYPRYVPQQAAYWDIAPH